jgi:hypothetical protein
VLVRVHCPKCGAHYETSLPPTGVRRVRRCAVCHRTGLEIVEVAEAGAAKDAPLSERADEQH